MARGERELTRGDVARAYQSVFSSEEGQIVLADLTSLFGFIRGTTIVAGDPCATHANEGSRYVLCHMGKMLEADPAKLDEPEETDYGE